MKTLILDQFQLEQKITRLAYEIYENNYREDDLIIAGIEPKGTTLSNSISKKLVEITGKKIGQATLKVNKENPLQSELVCETGGCEFTGKTVILVDDVLNTGRTMMYGIKYFLEYPIKSLQTLVIVDRDHKLFPVKANYIGLSLSTNLQEHVEVDLTPQKESVYLL